MRKFQSIQCNSKHPPWVLCWLLLRQTKRVKINEYAYYFKHNFTTHMACIRDYMIIDFFKILMTTLSYYFKTFWVNLNAEFIIKLAEFLAKSNRDHKNITDDIVKSWWYGFPENSTHMTIKDHMFIDFSIMVQPTCILKPWQTSLIIVIASPSWS